MPRARPDTPAADRMAVLADPMRRAIFEMLAEGQSSVGEIAARLPVTRPAVSQHLRALREAGLVTERRDGRHIYYRPAPTGLAPLADWLSTYEAFWRERFEKLEKLLEESGDE